MRYLLSEQERNGLIAYLETRPYKEVAGGIHALMNLKEYTPEVKESIEEN